jgi:hypothetical protein
MLIVKLSIQISTCFQLRDSALPLTLREELVTLLVYLLTHLNLSGDYVYHVR